MQQIRNAHEETRIENLKDSNRIRSDTILSIREKNIIEKITNKKLENQKDAKKKLIWVSIVCIFFMIVESVGVSKNIY